MTNHLLCSLLFVASLISPVILSADFCREYKESGRKIRVFQNNSADVLIMVDDHYYLIKNINSKWILESKRGKKYSGFDSNYDELYPAEACCYVNQDLRSQPIILLYDSTTNSTEFRILKEDQDNKHLYGINHLIPDLYHNTNDTNKALKKICRLMAYSGGKCYLSNVQHLTGNIEEKDQENINYVEQQKHLNDIPSEGSEMTFRLPIHKAGSDSADQQVYLVLYIYYDYIVVCEWLNKECISRHILINCGQPLVGINTSSSKSPGPSDSSRSLENWDNNSRAFEGRYNSGPIIVNNITPTWPFVLILLVLILIAVFFGVLLLDKFGYLSWCYRTTSNGRQPRATFVQPNPNRNEESNGLLVQIEQDFSDRGVSRAPNN